MADFVIVLGNKNYSSWSLRPWLALKRTGAAFSEIVIPLGRPETKEEIARHSPSGRVPVLRHGPRVIWESIAICEYLAEAFPESQLWPTDAEARAHARAIGCEMHAGFAALRRALPMDIRRRTATPPLAPDVESDVARVAGIWRDCRRRYGTGGDFLFGAFSIADAMFAPVATRFLTYGVGVDPTVNGYVRALVEWPAMREWAAAAAAEPWTYA